LFRLLSRAARSDNTGQVWGVRRSTRRRRFPRRRPRSLSWSLLPQASLPEDACLGLLLQSSARLASNRDKSLRGGLLGHQGGGGAL